MRVLLALSITFCSIAWYPIDLSSDREKMVRGKVSLPKKKRNKKQVALTFDACERYHPSYFDFRILNYLLEKKIPSTFFISGKFLERNNLMVKSLSYYSFIEVENHSYSHEILKDKSEEYLHKDIMRNSRLIEKVTRRKPRFFRFPGGLYDKKALEMVGYLGLKTVHWSFESGDPDKEMTAEKLIRHVLKQVKDGSVLIFHINRRGWHTGEALPAIVYHLKARGYEFVLLKDLRKIPYVR